MKNEYINPKTLFNSRPYGFSQMVMSTPGKMVFISGQVACDTNLNIVGENDLARQTAKSLENLKMTMEAAGGTLADIVMLRIYKVNYQKEGSVVISQILKENFKSQRLQASTWLSVKGLANKGFLIGIEAQAIV